MKNNNYKYIFYMSLAGMMAGCTSYKDVEIVKEIEKISGVKKEAIAQKIKDLGFILNKKEVNSPTWYKESDDKVLNKSFYYGLGEGKTINEAKEEALLKIKKEILKKEEKREEESQKIKNKISKKEINIGIEDLKLIDVFMTNKEKIEDRYFVKIQITKADLIDFYKKIIEGYKEEMLDKHKKALYSKKPYYQYKYYTEIDEMMKEVINNEHILYLLEGDEEYKKETYELLNKYLETFYKLKNNMNFKIKQINDSNLLKFVKLSLIDKDFKITNEENEYTLYLNLLTKKVKKEYEGDSYTYITIVKITNPKDDLFNTIVLKTEVQFKNTIEETMYNVYLDIKNQLNERNLFN